MEIAAGAGEKASERDLLLGKRKVEVLGAFAFQEGCWGAVAGRCWLPLCAGAAWLPSDAGSLRREALGAEGFTALQQQPSAGSPSDPKSLPLLWRSRDV